MSKRRLAGSLVLAVLIALTATVAAAEPRGFFGGGTPGGPTFEIGLIGDIPYNAEQEAQTAYLFEELDGESLAFVAHDGDIKSGSSACTEDVYAKEFDRFEGSENPLVYTPGDNEWTDCHRPPNPSPEEADPLNRLDLVRRTFFHADESLGESTIPLARQGAGYPENARWSYGALTFAIPHLVGSNNNRPTAASPDTGDEEEYGARNAANLEWLAGTFQEARTNSSAGMMLIVQANPFEEDTGQPSGFTDFKTALEEEAVAFGRPVVLVHGDTHTFRIDKPMTSSTTGEGVQNFARVETFSSPDVHWVRTLVDTRDPEVFTFQQEVIEDNTMPTP